MNKAYKVSHILDDVLEAYDDEMGVDPDSYYVVNDGEIIDGPFDTEDEANDASENDDDEILMGSEINDEYEDDDYEEDYDIEETKRGEGPCGKDTHLRYSKAQGKCYAPISGSGRGRQSLHGCGKGQKWNEKRGCYDPQKGRRGRPSTGNAGVGSAADKKAYKAKVARTPRKATMESLASSIIRKINSF